MLHRFGVASSKGSECSRLDAHHVHLFVVYCSHASLPDNLSLQDRRAVEFSRSPSLGLPQRSRHQSTNLRPLLTNLRPLLGILSRRNRMLAQRGNGILACREGTCILYQV